MRRIELELEHRYKNRFVGRHIIQSTARTAILGSAREADIRLLGDEIGGVHATLEYSDNGWIVSDMGSDHGTWINKKPVVRHEIKEATVISIGGHHLKLVPKQIDCELFYEKQSPAVKGPDQFHQVVLRKQGFVINSWLLKPNEHFQVQLGNEQKKFPPPQGDEWHNHQFGDVIVQQRLITSQVISQTGAEKIKGMVDSSMNKPLAAAALLLLMIWALVIFAPLKPDDELTELKPETNQYTRVIFDAKKVRQKREQSLKMRKTIAGKSNNHRSTVNRSSLQPSAHKAKGKSTQVISRIKAAGLSQLVGRISKRAAKNVMFVQSTGVTPDVTSGPALAQAGSIGKVGAKIGSKTGQFKISGVGTAGKAGGSTSYKGIGGLAAGNVGNGTVGILEEETEIQGGLDREVIAAVIHSQLGQIRYCYERQLSANPDIYGKVLVKFTIGATGSVVAQRVGTSTLNNAMVEGCMLRRIASWKFPKPKGGTSVLVSYPFLFKATN